jgi:hypothetical protein
MQNQIIYVESSYGPYNPRVVTNGFTTILSHKQQPLYIVEVTSYLKNTIKFSLWCQNQFFYLKIEFNNKGKDTSTLILNSILKHEWNPTMLSFIVMKINFIHIELEKLENNKM